MSFNRNASIAALCVALGASVATVGCGSTETKPSLGETIDDSVITSKVKARFLEDKETSVLDIKVETFKGIVQLSGFVSTRAEADRAVALAQGVTGVQSVKNDMRLK